MIDYTRYYIAHLVRPELEAASLSIAEIATRLAPTAQLAERITQGAEEYIAQRCCWMLQKVYVGELQQFVSGYGGQAGSAFEAYEQALIEDAGWVAKRHAFLFCRVRTAIDQFVNYLDLHCRHLAQDYQNLLRCGLFAADGLLEITFGLGDPHKRGMTTTRYGFAHGDVYYKPRSFELDSLFSEIVGLACPDVPLLESLNGVDHGWQRGVPAGEPEGEEAACRFYEHLGQLTALAHALCGSDIHYENIVTDGKGNPYFIDLEALFTNPTRIGRVPDPGFPRMLAELEWDRRMSESVLNVGVVTLRRTREGAFSGAAQADAVTTPVSREVAVDARTDRMRLARVKTEVPIKTPVPRVDGRPARFEAYMPAFCDAYAYTATKLFNMRDEVMARIEARPALRSRQILRHTYIYGLFQAETTHPALSSEESTTGLLSKLRKEETAKPYLSRVHSHEVSQMLRFDVPFFDAAVHGTSLGYEDTELPGFFERAAAEIVRERLLAMGRSKWVEDQLGFVRMVFGCQPPTAAPDTAARDAVWERLQETAIHGEDGTVLWCISPPADMPGAELAIVPMGPDIYAGLAGIVFYLMERSKRDPGALDLLHRAVETGRRLVVDREGLIPVAAYTGGDGLLLALARAGHAFDRPELVDLAMETFLGRVPRRDRGKLDVLDGTAGLVLVACGLLKTGHDPRLAQVVQALCEELVAAAVPCDGGMEWPCAQLGKAVTGLAHGSSGIAVALLEGFHATGTVSFVKTGLQALASEDARFCENTRLWPDTRAAEFAYSLGWCNGSTGFLLARHAYWAWLDESAQRRARQGFERTCEWFDGITDDSLCHGKAGAYLALRLIAADLGWPLPVAPPLSEPGLPFITGWRGEPDNQGLMVGGAGADYEVWLQPGSDFNPLTLRVSDVSAAPGIYPISLADEQSRST